MCRTRVLIALALLQSPPARGAEPATFVRVVVLDTSGSMAGERLATAKKELLDLARALPPATPRPVVVIPFTERVGEVRTFTDLPSFEAYLDKVVVGGGTRIAAALERASAEVARYPDARHACVLLYTDGEDTDRDGIARQEERLDRVFADRQKRGLGQSVVFCKRWQQANAALLKQVAARGHARVVDAGTAPLLPVTLAPAVTVTAARWAGDGSGAIEVDLTAGATAVGLPKGAAVPGLKLICRTAGVTGDVTVEAPVGSTRAFRIRVPAPMAAGAKDVGLEFEAGAPAEVASPAGLLFPLAAAERVRVTVPVPPRAVPLALTATATAGGPAAWADPVRRVARVPVRVAVRASAPAGESWPGPVSVRLAALPGMRLAAGDDTLTQAGPDPATAVVTVEGPPPPGGAPWPVGVTVTALAAPPGVTLNPPQAKAPVQVPPPEPVPTAIAVRVARVGPARWVNLAQGVAAFAADVEVRVDGPLPPDGKVLVRSPPGVRALAFRPGVLRPGTQTVRFEIEAAVPAAPGRAGFAFDVFPPPLPDSIRVPPLPPVRIEVTGPPAVRLALARHETAPAVVDVRTRDPDRVLPLRLTPVVAGWGDPAAARGLAASVTGGPGLRWSGADRPWDVGAPADLAVRAPPGRETSFFYDTVVEAEVSVAPAVPTPAVVGSRQTVRLRVEAPFKRVAFYVAGGLSAVLAAYFLARMVRRVWAGDRP